MPNKRGRNQSRTHYSGVDFNKSNDLSPGKNTEHLKAKKILPHEPNNILKPKTHLKIRSPEQRAQLQQKNLSPVVSIEDVILSSERIRHEDEE